MDFKQGEILSFDKPYGWSSFAVVNKVRYHLCKKLGVKKLKVGHAGTLDPLATGVLVICTGKATKRIEEFQKCRDLCSVENFEYSHYNEQFGSDVNHFFVVAEDTRQELTSESIQHCETYHYSDAEVYCGISMILDGIQVFTTIIVRNKNRRCRGDTICNHKGKADHCLYNLICSERLLS